MESAHRKGRCTCSCGKCTSSAKLIAELSSQLATAKEETAEKDTKAKERFNRAMAHKDALTKKLQDYLDQELLASVHRSKEENADNRRLALQEATNRQRNAELDRREEEDAAARASSKTNGSNSVGGKVAVSKFSDQDILDAHKDGALTFEEQKKARELRYDGKINQKKEQKEREEEHGDRYRAIMKQRQAKLAARKKAAEAEAGNNHWSNEATDEATGSFAEVFYRAHGQDGQPDMASPDTYNHNAAAAATTTVKAPASARTARNPTFGQH